ncbi:hypothetical protein V2J09_019377 [Rumex salicifolius]
MSVRLDANRPNLLLPVPFSVAECYREARTMDSIAQTSHDTPVLLEFRAGKMFLEGKRVIPDTRKGLIRLTRGEEGLVHFQWLDRVQNVAEDDMIVFPEEAVFEKIDQTAGRVYILKFNSDDRKLFFWMQEPKSDGDSELCRLFNMHINQPLDLFEDDEPGASVPLEDMLEDDLSSRAGNLISPGIGAEMSSDVTSSLGPVKLADLQRILSNIVSQDDAGDPDAGLGLGDLLKLDLVLPLLEQLPIEDRLAPYLPEGQQTRTDLIELLQSPPFHQQVDAFTYVLKTGQIDLSQFGIDPSKYKFTVLSFLEALEDSVLKQLESSDSKQQAGGTDAMDEGWVEQHLKSAFRLVVMISVSARSSILTTSENGGLTSGLASQQRVMISARIGRHSFGIPGRTPLFTTAKAACTAVMFWNGRNPVISSHRTIPKLYTSTFWVYGLC